MLLRGEALQMVAKVRINGQWLLLHETHLKEVLAKVRAPDIQQVHFVKSETTWYMPRTHHSILIYQTLLTSTAQVL